MKKYLIPFIFAFISVAVFAQEEKFPVFEGCEGKNSAELIQCFREKVTSEVISNINLPEEVKNDSIEGIVNVVYFVTKEGEFKVLHVNTPYNDFQLEVKRVFETLPKVC